MKHVVKEQIEGRNRRGRRRKQLLEDHMERKYTRLRKRTQPFALPGEHALKASTDLAQDELGNKATITVQYQLYK